MNTYSINRIDKDGTTVEMSDVVDFVECELGKPLETIACGEITYTPNPNFTKIVNENLGEISVSRLLSRKIIPQRTINEVRDKFGYNLSFDKDYFDETSGGMC